MTNVQTVVTSTPPQPHLTEGRVVLKDVSWQTLKHCWRIWETGEPVELHITQDYYTE